MKKTKFTASSSSSKREINNDDSEAEEGNDNLVGDDNIVGDYNMKDYDVDGDDDDDDDDDDEEDDDQESLPRMLYYHSIRIMEEYNNKRVEKWSSTTSSSSIMPPLPPLQQSTEASTIDKAEKSLIKSMDIVFALNPDLKIMHEKFLKRNKDDGKVPPGSSAVQRDISDNRYLLCLINIDLSKLYDLRGDFINVMRVLKDSLMWCPKSSEANFLLARFNHSVADNDEKLKRVEMLLLKSVSFINELRSCLSKIESDNARKHLEKLEKLKINKKGVKRDVTGDHNYDDEDEDDCDELLIDLLQKELNSAHLARQSLSLLYCQSGKANESRKHLEALGFRWRLSLDILNYQNNKSNNKFEEKDNKKKKIKKDNSSNNSNNNNNIVAAIDNVLPNDMLLHLRDVFKSDSSFWKEHDYDVLSNCSRKSGYFSYLYPLKIRQANNSIEQIIDKIFPIICKQFPHVKDECNFAEWWVHSRPHSCGHQLHFDSDETLIDISAASSSSSSSSCCSSSKGHTAPVHPMVSCVFFINEGSIGGPTLVTNQILGGNLADEGWLAYPQENRLVMFDAQYLHGVIPGKGINPDPSNRRLSFMVGFWKDIKARDRGLDNPGPGQNFPDPKLTSYAWPSIMPMQSSEFGNKELESTHVDVTCLSSVWEPIDKGSNSGGLLMKGIKQPHYDHCFQGF
jgi:hypothetical protein